MMIPKPLSQEGFAVPLKASFVVFKALPLLAVAHNNATPRLTLFEDRLEYRVIRLTRKNYADIEAVDARQWLGTQSLILGWRGRMMGLACNVGAEDPLIALLEFFASRGGKLTTRARRILKPLKN
jgi:hypothetical protein